MDTSISAAGARKKMGFNMRSSSLEIEETKKRNSSLSPLHSPKSKGKEAEIYVVLYNFKGKEKDDMDLRAGWRLTVSNSSDPDWWKGKCNGKVGYFPSTYVQRLHPGQRVFQVQQTMNLTEKELGFGMRLHKDQIVFQVGEETSEMIHVQAPNKKQAMCPVKFLKEV
ncbi:SH3 and cysteine-rich domain-containing protein 3-like [Gigantopelta aegis]|uniref:SH3 and cysteine-rich domain-containing protein 3-like n=1 Tax=Gigantopelta aegis TaxID=1735272 RepID=UPI001B88B409|nr:SH3 and cysteine-rich domain-containing protein 3-like [Gigantopelta aegis]